MGVDRARGATTKVMLHASTQHRHALHHVITVETINRHHGEHLRFRQQQFRVVGREVLLKVSPRCKHFGGPIGISVGTNKCRNSAEGIGAPRINGIIKKRGVPLPCQHSDCWISEL